MLLKNQNTNRVIFISLLVIITPLFIAQCQPTKQQPNVIFFLVDDMGWKDVSYQGSEFYETPNIDEVANKAMKFTQAYSAHPRCVPSRYAMITGKYPARINSPGRGEGKMTDAEFTMAEAFKEGGYTTFFAGKWHLSSAGSYPHTQGFDYNYGGGHAGAPKSYFQPYNVKKNPKNGNGKEKDIENLDDAADGYYLTDHLTDKTVEFIKNNKDKPFFVYLSHYGVHTPFEGKQEKVKKYKKKVKAMGEADGKEFLFEETTGETKVRQDNATYAAMVESIDESFGRVTKLLDELNLTDNTIIVFTSDHGGLSNRGNGRKLATSNLPLRAGKGHNYEGGIRVPVFVSYPAKVKAGSSPTVLTGTDYYPTLLELAKLPAQKEQHLDGVSFAKSVYGKKEKRDDRPIFWHSPKPRPKNTGDRANTAVRKGDFKLLDFYDEGRVELYNIAQDEEEKNNLADSMPKKRDEMLAHIKDWRKEVKAYMGKKK